VKFQIGDRVTPTARCRKLWKNNRFGIGVGTITGALSSSSHWVEWEGNGGMKYFYDDSLLELVPIQLEND
jgi:hypothetical protein